MTRMYEDQENDEAQSMPCREAYITIAPSAYGVNVSTVNRGFSGDIYHSCVIDHFRIVPATRARGPLRPRMKFQFRQEN